MKRIAAIHKGTLRLMVLKQHRNHLTLFKAKCVKRISRRPWLVLMIMAIGWEYLGIGAGQQTTVNE